jgi:hypothetical protein
VKPPSVRRVASPRRVAVLAASVVLALSGFGVTSNDPGKVDAAAEKVKVALADAVDRLEGDLLNFNEVFKTLRDKVTGIDSDVARLVRTEVENLSERAVAAVGVEFRCGVDFLGKRMLEGLVRIQSLITGAKPQLTPTFCSASPSSVELALPPERRNRIEFTGYNFDSDPPVELWIIRPASAEHVKHLAKVTAYQMIANLGGANSQEGVQVDLTTDRLELRWKGKVMSEITVVKPPPLPKCVAQTVFSRAATHTVIPVHTREGDKEIFGKGDVWLNVWRENTPTEVFVRISMKVRQYDDDHSTAEVTSEPVKIFDVPAGFRILGISASQQDPEVSYRDGDWEDDVLGGGGGLVARWVVRAEGPREDLNGWARATASINPLQIEIIPTSGCVV